MGNNSSEEAKIEIGENKKMILDKIFKQKVRMIFFFFYIFFFKIFINFYFQFREQKNGKIDLKGTILGDSGVNFLIEGMKSGKYNNEKKDLNLDISWNNITDTGFNIISNFIFTKCDNNNIVELNIERNEIKKIGNENLGKILNENGKLRVLNFSNNYVENGTLDIFFEILIKNNKIEKLFISGVNMRDCMNIPTNKDFDKILDNFLNENEKKTKIFGLQVLDVSHNNLDENSLKFINKFLLKTDLKKLNVSGNFLRENLKVLIPSFKFLSNLKSLDLSENDLDNKIIEIVLNSLSNSIEKINLSRNKNFKNENILFHFLTEKNVKKLNLSDIYLPNSFFEKIQLSMENKDSLTHLSLKNVSISEWGMKFLAKYLQKSTFLKFLDLSQNNLITCLSEFKTAIFDNKSVRYLNISNNKLETEFLCELISKNNFLTKIDFSLNSISRALTYEELQNLERKIFTSFENNNSLVSISFPELISKIRNKLEEFLKFRKVINRAKKLVILSHKFKVLPFSQLPKVILFYLFSFI